MNDSTLTIAAVERDTGLSKDLLRVWERRYGFPKPQRDAAGERAYAQEQVSRLRIVKRLLDDGHRPGRVLQLDAADLQALATRAGHAADRHAPADPGALGDGQRQLLLALLRSHDLPALAGFLQCQLGDLEHRVSAESAGSAPFGLQRAAALNAAVADAWLRGALDAFEERAYQQQMQSLLRAAVARMASAADSPQATPQPAVRVLLTTLPGEPQDTGLLLAQAVLLAHGCTCIALGSQLAPWDIARAAEAYRADIATLAFGGALAPNAVVHGLAELRGKLPPALALWAVGRLPVLQRRRVAGVQPLPGVRDLPGALAEWRTRQADAHALPALTLEEPAPAHPVPHLQMQAGR